jgi:PhzF family phenazine biosynthesis protein
MTRVLRYAAFTDHPDGGNPAGVVLDASGMDASSMLSVAADVGYSETAFVVPDDGDRFSVRYFSPRAEVPFCGHATIATAVALARDQERRRADYEFLTPAGAVPVSVREGQDGLIATLTSVEPSVREVDPQDVREVLGALGWSSDELDPRFPPRVAYAGAHHLVLAAATRDRLARLAYDFDRLQRLMLARDWTTVDLVWAESPDVFHSRNLFPPGGVREDPATGAAAAAFGAYLRELGFVSAPARFTVRQGEDFGRPSVLVVDVPPGAASGIKVSGGAVPI